MATNMNFSQFSAKLRQAVSKFEQEVQSVVEFNIGEMELEARRLAPGGGDQIRTQSGTENETDVRQSKSAKGSVAPIDQCIAYKIDASKYKGTLMLSDSAGTFGIWIEFGTGQSAASYVPTLPQEMQAVARRYYINGKGTIINQPYMFPAYMKYKEEFIKDLKDVIKNFGKGV